MRLSYISVPAVILSLCLMGCSGEFTHKLKFNPGEPIRVAVMPFIEVDSEGLELSEPTPNLLIDQVGIISSEPLEIPTKFVRTLVQNQLTDLGVEHVDPQLIEIELPHHGFGTEDGRIDTKKLYATKASDICQHLLQCDAVMFGKILSWQRNYYGIESVNRVAIELVLRSARDNRILFSARGEDADRRGISGGPTGFSDIILEPLRGLNSETIEDLARNVVAKTLEPLRTGDGDISQSSPPSVYASVYRWISNTSAPPTLIVLVYGSPGLTASFTVGSTSGAIAMEEKNEGHYFGFFVPQPGEVLDNLPITATLTDRRKRSSSQQVFSAH